MADKGSGGSVPGEGDKGGGGNSGTTLAEGPNGPPNQNTVGASVGATNVPMINLGGGRFSLGSDDTISDLRPEGQTSNPSSWAASINNPQGITASPTAGGFPSDLTSQFDPLGSNVSQGAGGPPSSGQMSPQDLGAPGGAIPAAAKPAGPAAAGDKSVMDQLGIKNPLGAAIGAAGLGYSVLQGQQQQKYSPEMQAQAARLDANGQQLMSYLQSGNLPPGLKASLDQATQGAKAKIISNFASQGLNTDPTQNSVLAQQLASVDQQAIISTAQMGQQLMASGIQQSGLSSDLYKTLANIDQTQTANIGKAIAAFAASMSGGGGGINLKLG